MLNHAKNFQGLPKSLNSSKGGKLPGDWTQALGQPLNPDYVNRNRATQPQLQNELQQMIDNFRNPAGS